jgi:hypothetical protein
MISQGRKHQEERVKEQESMSDTERETFFKVARAQEFFPPLLSLNSPQSKRERAKAGSLELDVKLSTIYLSSTFFIVELADG